MRTHSLILALAGLFWVHSGSVQAQSLRGWGIEGGVTFSNQKWSEHVDLGRTDPSWNMHDFITVGGFAEVQLVRRFSSLVRVAYEQRGVETHRSFPEAENDAHFNRSILLYRPKFDYLTLALLGKVRLFEGDGHQLNPYVAGGPVGSLFLRDQETTMLDYEDGTYLSRPSPFRSVSTVGMQLSVGAEVATGGPATMLVEVAYLAGLTNTLRQGAARDRVLGVRAGIRY